MDAIDIFADINWSIDDSHNEKFKNQMSESELDKLRQFEATASGLLLEEIKEKTKGLVEIDW